MALVLKDRVKESTTTAGTGTVTLLGAAPGFQSFASIGDANTTYYTIAGQTTSEWEVGIGTYTSSGTTLARTTVLSNSSGTEPSALSFSAGTKDVFVTYPAGKSVNLDASGNVTALGTPVSATLTNATGLPISSGVSGLGSNVATFLATPSSVNLAAAVTDETGTGALVFATSPTLVTPALGTPSALVGTNITGTASGLTAGNVTTNANLTGAVTSTGNATVLGSFSSASLAGALTDETGTGSAVFATSPTLVTPALGTPSALVGTNITGTASGLTAGNVTTNANLTGAVTSVGNATSLGSFTSSQLLGALTDETGTGAAVFATSPTLVTPALGTPSALVGTNITGTASGLTAGNVTTNANLTGAITSTGNATLLGSFTSAQLLAALTDETGTGANVFATSPTLVTPVLGAATGTSVVLTGAAPQVTLGANVTTLGSVKMFGNTSGDATVRPAAVAGTATVVTLPNASSTLPIFGQQITFTGPTTARTITLPDASFTVARTDAANTFTGVQTMTSPALTTPAITGLATGTGVATANTVSTLVARDASGNFSAGTITAALTGTASGNLVSGGALGTPSSGTLTNCTFPTLNQNTSGTAAGLSATLVATSGGTGQSSYAVGDILFASTTTALSKLADVATGSALISGGVGVAPSYGKIGLTTHVSGNLPVTNLNSGTSASASTFWRGDGAWAAPAAAVIGTDTQVTYNNAGTMAGSANLTFNGTNLTCGGTVTANSDERLKTNWRDLPENFVERLADVKHGVYDRTDIEATQVGVSAQSLQTLLEQAVLVGEDGTLSVAYGNAALVACIQLAQRVVALEQTVAKLTKGI